MKQDILHVYRRVTNSSRLRENNDEPQASAKPEPPPRPIRRYGFDEGDHLGNQKLRLLFNGTAARSDGLRTIMVVGCRASAGSTTTAAALARTLTEGSRPRVLLIDANLRTPALHIVFGMANERGLYDLVLEKSDRDRPIHETRYPNLSLLTTGGLPPSPEAMFEDGRMDQLLAGLKQDFHFVILDSAPVLEFPDAYGIAPKVDGVVLVVEAERTSVHEAQRAKRDLELAGGRVIGAVLNRERDYRPRFLRRFFR